MSCVGARKTADFLQAGLQRVAGSFSTPGRTEVGQVPSACVGIHACKACWTKHLYNLRVSPLGLLGHGNGLLDSTLAARFQVPEEARSLKQMSLSAVVSGLLPSLLVQKLRALHHEAGAHLAEVSKLSCYPAIASARLDAVETFAGLQLMLRADSPAAEC